MMNRYLLISFILMAFSSHSQETNLLFTIETESSSFTADVLGNIYTVNGTEIIKYDEKGNQCCTYSDRTFGEITSIDTRDPLRILVFYKPFGAVKLLDNKLAEQLSVNLFSLDLKDPTVVCSSEMQGMWVFDNATYRLYKFNEQFQPVSLSNDLRQDVMENISPYMMTESDYWLVMLDKEALYVFDKMGNYFKPIPYKEGTSGQLIHDEWIYEENEKLIKVNLRTGNTTELLIPFPEKGKMVIAPQRILHHHGNKLDVYAL